MLCVHLQSDRQDHPNKQVAKDPTHTIRATWRTGWHLKADPSDSYRLHIPHLTLRMHLYLRQSNQGTLSPNLNLAF